MDGHITAGIAILRTTGAIQLGASVGAAGQRITTTPLAAVREAAHSDPHPVAADRLEALREDHQLVVAPGHPVAALDRHRPHGRRLVEEAPGHPVVALAHHPRAHHLVAEVPGHPEAALVRHRPREHHSVAAQQERQRVVGSAHPEPAAPARLDRVHHPVALDLRVHHLAVAPPAQEAAHAQAAVASSVGEAAAHVRVAVVSSAEEAVRAPAVAVSLVVAAADAAQVALEAAGDD